MNVVDKAFFDGQNPLSDIPTEWHLLIDDHSHNPEFLIFLIFHNLIIWAI